MKTTNVNFKKQLQNDDVFTTNSIVDLNAISQYPFRKGYDKAIISNGEVVNIVSKSYGHLSNEDFFLKVEEKLIHADLHYDVRSINRENRSFAVDYILNDPNCIIDVKNGLDKIKPMLRFTNGYDGSTKTSGYFGYFREVCSNGLHISHTEVGFSVKHKGNIAEFIMPEIKSLVSKFIDNEFYTIKRKFEVLAESPITNIQDFVKSVCAKTALFQFEASEKNPEPSLNARMVIDTINSEANLLGTSPNLWLGYNAFNEVLHTKLKKTFESQKNMDDRIFSIVSEMALN